MRLIIGFSTLGALLLFSGIVSADLIQDCLTRCSNEKASDDMNCPAPEQGKGQGRAQCLQSNKDIYDNCIRSCSPNAPVAEPPAPAKPSNPAKPSTTGNPSTPGNTPPPAANQHTDAASPKDN
jgi:hypothetical protein